MIWLGDMSAVESATPLANKHCVPCEGGVPPLARADAERLLPDIPGWALSDDAKQLTRSWRLQDFADALGLVNRIGTLAEAEGHHPDLHLTGYRHLRVELTTHAVGGLSENDFILAAKINQLEKGGRRPPVALEKGGLPSAAPTGEKGGLPPAAPTGARGGEIQ